MSEPACWKCGYKPPPERSGALLTARIVCFAGSFAQSFRCRDKRSCRARAKRSPAVENTWEAIEAAMLPIVQTDEGAIEVASAFYDVAWVRDDLPVQTYTEAMDHRYDNEAWTDAFSLSWRGAGEMVARLRNRGETYMDWAWDMQAEKVSDRVREAMAALGLRPVL